MRADIFTKAFHQKDKWHSARVLINILDPDEVKQTIESQGDLGANDRPRSVWEKSSNDETIAPTGSTGPEMEVDHDPRDSEALAK